MFNVAPAHTPLREELKPAPNVLLAPSAQATAAQMYPIVPHAPVANTVPPSGPPTATCALTARLAISHHLARLCVPLALLAAISRTLANQGTQALTGVPYALPVPSQQRVHRTARCVTRARTTLHLAAQSVCHAPQGITAQLTGLRAPLAKLDTLAIKSVQ